ncbi:MAG: pyridoxal-phosphate dependent enzyme [Gemmatimonadota bacterium]|nr:pyridoxal-phosphate dependent enzyme [Gemmatimonadota bacterium]
MTASAPTVRARAGRVGTLIDYFPALASLPRAGLLGALPTPVTPSALAPALWIKRDDLTALPIGGNKVRALDFLLGGLEAGATVLTAGAVGSTHVLTTIVHAKRLGARTSVIRWPQEMNDVARVVARRIEAEADDIHTARSVPGAYWGALRTRAFHDVRWVPPGGTSVLGILGHVDAVLELARQIAAGACPVPARIVVPLGSGGTAAGLALGLEITGLPTRVVGVRVVSRIVANRGRVLRFAARAARLIERRAPGARVPRVSPDRLQVAEGYFGGAYGRETSEGRAAAERFRDGHGPTTLEPTYTAKAFAAALATCDGEPTLFWLTFDSRWLWEPGTGNSDLA